MGDEKGNSRNHHRNKTGETKAFINHSRIKNRRNKSITSITVEKEIVQMLITVETLPSSNDPSGKINQPRTTSCRDGPDHAHTARTTVTLPCSLSISQ